MVRNASGKKRAPQLFIFSYGTLRQPDVQRALFGRSVDAQPDILAGFRIGTVTITNPDVIRLSGSSDHPGLVRTGDPADEVPGVALAVTAAELAAADAYEAADYVRTAVRLKSGRDAFIYLPRG